MASTQAGAAAAPARGAGLAAWLRRRDPVRWALAAMLAAWALTFIVLGIRSHRHFATFGFDLGIYDQATWLLAHFEDPLITVRGLDVFAHHLTPVLWAFLPFYRLGAGPEFLLIVQVIAQASGALAVFLLARDRLQSRWVAVALAGVLLLNPTYQFLAWEYFHPETLAIAPLLFAYWAARTKRWRLFFSAAVLAVACKEELALAIASLGILVAFRGDRRTGALTAVIAGGWYLLGTRVLMPTLNDGLAPFYEEYFAEFGATSGEVVRHVVANPTGTLRAATRPDRLTYFLRMLAPLALLPLFALPALLVAGPMIAINALATFPYARDFRFHYSAIVVAGLIVATVEALAWLGTSRRARGALAGVVVLAALATSVAWGPSPIGTQYEQYWPRTDDPRHSARRAALAVVPRDAPVSAGYNLVAHLAHRTRVYQFPEPWVRVTWGVHGEGLPAPAGVDWLVVDRTVVGDGDRALLAGLLVEEFTARFDRDGVVAAERVRPPPPAETDPEGPSGPGS